MLLLIFLILLSACILGNAPLSMHYAGIGLELWFRSMIPALLPFMILSGIMIRMGLTEKAAMLVYPFLRPFYRVRKNVVYAILLGFLCGFPMGARVTADLYSRKLLSKREAEYLLAFCNNIGPVYFCSFALPMLKRELVLPYLTGMYGIPLLYGLVLRYTVYRDLQTEGKEKPKQACGRAGGSQNPARLLSAVDESVKASLQSIVTLGGYMVLFNLLNLLPHCFLGRASKLLAPLLEITGGLSMLGNGLPLYSLLALSFGGLSCTAQTYSCISDTELSLAGYLLHKVVLTLLNGIFYLCWFLVFPSVFLR